MLDNLLFFYLTHSRGFFGRHQNFLLRFTDFYLVTSKMFGRFFQTKVAFAEHMNFKQVCSYKLKINEFTVH